MQWRYIDTHAHLNLGAFRDDVADVMARCREESVAVINVGTKLATSRRAVELAETADNCFAIVGLHPIQTTPGHHDEDELGPGGQPFASKGEAFDTTAFRELALHEKVVGIGECGFDYFHTTADSYAVQEAAFIAQIELANELGLPLMIHTRDPKSGPSTSPTGRSAYDDVYDILTRYARVPANLHFFAGTWEQATRFFDLGCTISFTGVITFPPKGRAGVGDYEEVVRKAPLDRIHAETDCPFVAPVPHRGKRAEPWMVTEVVQKIAELKSLPAADVASQLTENAANTYRIG